VHKTASLLTKISVFFLRSLFEDCATVGKTQMYFCKGKDYEEKVDLSKDYWNPKRKMWVTTHFSEIIKQT